MKFLMFFFFIVVSGMIYSQEWRDSLETARTLYKKKDYGKALKYYESAQKKAPEGVDLSDEIGQSAYKARQFELSEKIYQQNTSNKRSEKQKSENYHNLGNSKMQKEDYQGAIDAYKSALKNNPDDEETRYNLSQAIRRLKAKKEKEEKNNQDQDQNQDQQNQDNKNQNGKDQNQGKGNQNKGNQNPKDGNQNQSQNGQNGKGNKDPKTGKGTNKNNNDPNGNPNDKMNNGSKIPNKSVERMLDQLMKAEASTKRRIGGNKGDVGTNKSGKDW
ncbi:MAG: tetratricopeptide repeat protein [Bacteroidetes bacterium]|nr:MAG: tetratricopeptide repeat protein [Bacteroidota bacterium]